MFAVRARCDHGPVTAPTQIPLEGMDAPAEDLVASRSDALYGVHSYHTKLPAAAIRSLIERHTAPGDLVLDPFCGSGMVGVAASLCGRRCALSDLSPAAVHIASNY